MDNKYFINIWLECGWMVVSVMRLMMLLSHISIHAMNWSNIIWVQFGHLSCTLHMELQSTKYDMKWSRQPLLRIYKNTHFILHENKVNIKFIIKIHTTILAKNYEKLLSTMVNMHLSLMNICPLVGFSYKMKS